eukprot:jgi/Mesen1/8402/ME000468S07833
MESAIIRDLEVRVLGYSAALLKAADATAELDCLVSLSLCAREYKLVKPSLTHNNVLHIKGGRWGRSCLLLRLFLLLLLLLLPPPPAAGCGVWTLNAFTLGALFSELLRATLCAVL